MTTLSSFTPEEADLIISLPYRVGMHVSYSEDEGGERDDALEMKALESVLRDVVKNEEKDGSLAQEVARATLEGKEKWEAWSQGVFNIEPLCEKTITMLKTQASVDEVKDYIRICLEIAGSVARAYGEFGEDDAAEEECSGIIGKIMGEISRIMPGTKGREAHHPMNISAAEDSAVERISAAMEKALGD
ncbi:MAG: hypothetical protein KAJ29_06125 [Alphaproteobacteria bacterium]|nr:hypothetical protein [Alphaproteobacteria bacterium]